MEQQADITDAARKTNIESNVGLAFHIADEMAARVPSHVDRGDLRSAAVLGLVEAAGRFDVTAGVPFVGYAGQRIRGAVLDFLRSGDWMSRTDRRIVRQVNELASSHTDDSADDGTIEGFDKTRVQEAVQRSQAPVSLDADDFDFSDGSESIEDVFIESEAHRLLATALDHMPKRHREILVSQFFDEEPMTETAIRIGVSPSRAAALRDEAIVALQHVFAGQYSEVTPDRLSHGQTLVASLLDAVPPRAPAEL